MDRAGLAIEGDPISCSKEFIEDPIFRVHQSRVEILTLLSISMIGLRTEDDNQPHILAGCYLMLDRRLIIGTISIVLSIILFWIFSTDFLVFVGLVKVPPQPSQDVSAS